MVSMAYLCLKLRETKNITKLLCTRRKKKIKCIHSTMTHIKRGWLSHQSEASPFTILCTNNRYVYIVPDRHFACLCLVYLVWHSLFPFNQGLCRGKYWLCRIEHMFQRKERNMGSYCVWKLGLLPTGSLDTFKGNARLSVSSLIDSSDSVTVQSFIYLTHECGPETSHSRCQCGSILVKNLLWCSVLYF